MIPLLPWPRVSIDYLRPPYAHRDCVPTARWERRPHKRKMCQKNGGKVERQAFASSMPPFWDNQSLSCHHSMDTSQHFWWECDVLQCSVKVASCHDDWSDNQPATTECVSRATIITRVTTYWKTVWIICSVNVSLSFRLCVGAGLLWGASWQMDVQRDPSGVHQTLPASEHSAGDLHGQQK